MTTTTINERVQSIVDTCFGGNKRAFAKQIGVSATVIENVVGKRNGKPSFDVLHSICANANISAEWLLTGEGAMLKGEREPQPVSEPPTAEPEVVEVLRQQLAEKDRQIAEKDRQLAERDKQTGILLSMLSAQKTPEKSPIGGV